VSTFDLVVGLTATGEGQRVVYHAADATVEDCRGFDEPARVDADHNLRDGKSPPQGHSETPSGTQYVNAAYIDITDSRERKVE
jgi:hypothetical protein